MSDPLANVQEVARALGRAGYIADDALATAVYVASRLDKPILAEGPAGVGKTELAKSLATALGTDLLRLQCYEGLDEARTLYEWKYPKQLLYTQMLRDHITQIVGDATDLHTAVERIGEHDDAFFSERFLQPRPILQAIRAPRRVVLLIDEIDRAEDELEAFFLEVLAEFQVTVPELGTIRAEHRPLVVITSNRSRELSDALRRRCLYLPMGHPSTEREAAIVSARVPGLAASLAGQISAFVRGLRDLDLRKSPSISETLDWARALVLLGVEELGEDLVHDTLNVLLKHEGDVDAATPRVSELLRS